MAEPGDICISRSIRDQIERKLALRFEDLGLREIKNIARSVRVYRVSAGRPPLRAPHQLSIPQSVPSIAVLPFANVSGDAANESFVDALTENVIASLSRFRDLAVIASHSTFAYKGKAVKIQDISQALGARYLLEGNVQRSGGQMRISAQLIDGATGQNLWTERYDRQGTDIFALQDEVTETIVGTLAAGYGGRLRKAWRGRANAKGKRNLKAFDHFLRGIEHEDRFTKVDNEQAKKHFARAVQLDPHYAKAIAKLAWSHIFDVLFDWSDDLAESWACARQYALLAVERDDDEAWGHWALGGYYLFQGQHGSALVEYQKAAELNPNDADVLADFGLFLSYAGQAEKGLDLVCKAMRLNPHYPEWYAEALGHAYYDLHRYEDAVATLEKFRTVDTVLVHLYLAASHAALGHVEESHHAIARVLKLEPAGKLDWLTRTDKAPYKDPKDLDHLRSCLREAGLPE
jgi:adenylate cyclase